MRIPKKPWLILQVLLLSVTMDMTGAGSIENWAQIQDPEVQYGNGERRLSDINVLLPLHNCADCRRVYHEIAAFNGCYQWKNTFEGLIDMIAFPSESHAECSNIVEVLVKHPKPFSQTVWLSARDLRTHSSLKAEVKVAKIHRIEIFSRFGQINKGDSQYLEAKAFDEERRAFTTLEGFNFDWTVVRGAANIMRVKPREAGHSKEHHKHGHDASEEGAKNDDDFYCRGLQAGVTTVQVKILEKGYEQVAPAFVNFTIVEPFTIQPDPALFTSALELRSSEETYILPTSEFPYRLSLIEMGEDLGLIHTDVKLPSAKYSWSLPASDKALGQIG
jgi:hypothetical protein